MNLLENILARKCYLCRTIFRNSGWNFYIRADPKTWPWASFVFALGRLGSALGLLGVSYWGLLYAMKCETDLSSCLTLVRPALVYFKYTFKDICSLFSSDGKVSKYIHSYNEMEDVNWVIWISPYIRPWWRVKIFNCKFCRRYTRVDNILQALLKTVITHLKQKQCLYWFHY